MAERITSKDIKHLKDLAYNTSFMDISSNYHAFLGFSVTSSWKPSLIPQDWVCPSWVFLTSLYLALAFCTYMQVLLCLTCPCILGLSTETAADSVPHRHLDKPLC